MMGITDNGDGQRYRGTLNASLSASVAGYAWHLNCTSATTGYSKEMKKGPLEVMYASSVYWK